MFNWFNQLPAAAQVTLIGGVVAGIFSVVVALTKDHPRVVALLLVIAAAGFIATYELHLLSDPVIGTWKWGGSTESRSQWVSFLENGDLKSSIATRDAAGTLSEEQNGTGKWKPINMTKGSYQLIWESAPGVYVPANFVHLSKGQTAVARERQGNFNHSRHEDGVTSHLGVCTHGICAVGVMHVQGRGLRRILPSKFPIL